MRPYFVDKIVLITTTLKSSYHWKTLVPFCLRKKNPENAILCELSQISQKNKLCHSKQE